MILKDAAKLYLGGVEVSKAFLGATEVFGFEPQPAILIESFDVDAGDFTTHTLTNDVGSLDRAFVKINNTTRKGTGGPIGNSGNAGPRLTGRPALLTDTDTITFQQGTSTQKAMGEVWRYVGPQGGEHEFVVRGRYEITLGSGVASNTAAVSGIANEADCVPFLAGIESASTSVNDYDAATLGVRMDGSGNVEVSRRATGHEITAYVTVVEFVGSAWTVASGVSSNHDSSHEDITLSADIGDWSQAFIEATGQGDTSETGLSDVMFHVIPLAATNQVRVEYQDGDGNARNDGTAYVYVMANPSLVVTRGQDTNLSEGNNSYGTAISLPVAAQGVSDDLQGLEWFPDTSGTGTAHARGALAARIVGDEIRHWVHRSGNNINVRYGVIDVSGLTYTGSAAPTLSLVDARESSPGASEGSTSADFSFSLTLPVGELVIIAVTTAGNPSNISGVTINGVAATEVIAPTKGNTNNTGLAAYRFNNTTAGSKTVAVQFSGNRLDTGVAIFEARNVTSITGYTTLPQTTSGPTIFASHTANTGAKIADSDDTRTVNWDDDIRSNENFYVAFWDAGTELTDPGFSGDYVFGVIEVT